jgi:hypothetical protein
MQVRASTATVVSVATEVWIATALLHKENPKATDFSNAEILARALREGLVEPQRPGVSAHVSAHAVAGKRPQPNDYRYLVETQRGRRRLYRDGDSSHADRNGKVVPSADDLPAAYLPLLQWYESWCKRAGNDPARDLLGELAGTWTYGRAEDYLRELRKGWD